MIAASQAFVDRISGNARQHRARFLLGGEPIDGDIKSVIVLKGSCGESEFRIGAVYSAILTAQIDNCTASLKGQELDFQMGLLLEDGNEDSVEYISIGQFVVTDTKASTYSVGITCSGRISAKCALVYVPTVSFPATIGAVLNDLEQQTGCPIDASAFSDMLHLTIDKQPMALLQREMLGIIAELFGGYVTENNAGVITFAKYTTIPTTAITADQSTQLYEFSENAVTINGIQVIVSEAVPSEDTTEGEITEESNETSGGITYVYGTPDVTMTNEYMTQEIFSVMVGNIVGYTYHPGNMPISLGNIRLEAFDVLLVRDSSGTAYTVPCMSVVHTYDGGVSTTIIAPDYDVQQSNTGGSLTRAVERMSAQLGMFEKIVAGKAEFTELETVRASIWDLQANALTADSAAIKTLIANSLTAEQADIIRANVDKLKTALLTADDILVDNMTAVDVNVTKWLTGVGIIGDVIKAGTILADRLALLGEDGLYYALNASSGSLTEKQLTDEKYQQYLDGSILVAKSVTSNQIAANAITAFQIAANAITAEKLAADAINATMIAFGDSNIYNVLGQTLETQATLQRILDSINLTVSNLSKEKSIINTNTEIEDWEVTEPPTMTNYPTVTDFYIWQVCASDTYCSDDLICGTADFANHKNSVAKDIITAQYYIFEETNGVYGWRALTAAEIESISQSYGSVIVDDGAVKIGASKNGNTGTLSVAPDGVRGSVIYCC